MKQSISMTMLLTLSDWVTSKATQRPNLNKFALYLNPKSIELGIEYGALFWCFGADIAH